MNDKTSKQECKCQCGTSTMTVHGTPITRMVCHCTICQAFNNAAYGDVTLFLAKDVDMCDKEKINFKKYKAPPAVERGKCVECNKPVVELLDLPLLPSLVIIPSGNIPPGPFVPDPSIHIFYHSRVADINDDLPKYSGFIKSQMALSAKIFSGILRRFINA